MKSCSICQENQPSQQREPLEPHNIPPAPWTKLATDLFEVDQEEYLLVTDYYSKYPVVYRLKTTTSAAVARVTADIFGLLGLPAEIVSDNGPRFIGGPYQDMCSRWAIKHTTSSPRYPQSNGLAERMVRTVKALIKKCKQTGQDIGIAMLHLRATPTDPSMLAPAEVMFGRPIRTTLPSRHAASTLQQSAETYERLLQRQSIMKEHHDTRRARPALPPLHVGQRVRVQDHQRHTWSPAEVTRVVY